METRSILRRFGNPNISSPVILSALLGLAATGWSATTLTVSPDSISNLYAGEITLTVSGLVSNEVVRLERFLDVNANSVVETTDFLMLSCLVGDGQAAAIGGATNLNQPHDTDAGVNGAIRVRLNYARTGEADHIVGRYIFRVSSPTGRFTAVTDTLQITNANLAQRISGTIRCAGTNVPRAWVVLLHGDGMFHSGTTADYLGNYSIKAPPGTYTVFPTKPGFVTQQSAAPVVSLAPGQTLSTNVTLLASNTTILGRLVDAANDAIRLPGVLISVESSDGLFTLCNTDTNGNFRAGARSGLWQPSTGDASVASLGYVSLRDAATPVANTATGAVQNLVVPLPKCNALIHGTLRDSGGAPLPGIEIDGDSGPYESFARSDPAGRYSLGVLSGAWEVAPDDDDLAFLGLYGQGVNVTLNQGQAFQADLLARAATTFVSGRVVDEIGSAVANACVGVGGEGSWASGTTDAAGYFRLGTFGGWRCVELCGDEAVNRGLVRPSTCLELTEGVDVTNVTLVARHVTARIGGLVRQTNGAPLAGAGVWASGRIQGQDYFVWADAGAGGGYTLGVCNGEWQVGVDLSDLAGFCLAYPSSQRIVVSGANRTADFNVEQAAPPQVWSSWIGGGVGCLLETQLTALDGCAPYTWSLEQGSAPLPPGLSLSADGSIRGVPQTNGQFTFIVRVTDGGGRIDTASVTADISGPLAIGNVDLASGLLGQPYEETLYCLNAASSYYWSVVSNALPPGLELLPPAQFSEYSTIGGTPTEAGEYCFMLRATNECGQADQRSFCIAIIAELTITNSCPLAQANVNRPYQCQLGAAGGQPPYSWSLSPGSSSLPPGLDLSPEGLLSGEPTEEGSFDFWVRVTDADFAQADKLLCLDIFFPPASPYFVSGSLLPGRQVNLPYSAALPVSGGTPPYVFSVAAGALPDGLALGTNDGTITGTPTVTGEFSFAATVTDQSFGTDTEWFAIHVYPTPPGIPLATTMANESLFGAASDGTNSLLAILDWAGPWVAPGKPVVTARLISSNGSQLAPTLLVATNSRSIAVGYDGARYLLVWEQIIDSSNTDLYGRFISRSGALDPQPPFLIADAPGAQNLDSRQGLRFGSNNYFLVWRDKRAGDWDVYGQFINTNGTLHMGNIPLAIGAGDQLASSLGYNGSNYLGLSLCQRPTGPELYDVWGQFGSALGPVGSPFLVSQTPTPPGSQVRVAFNGQRFMVVWGLTSSDDAPNPNGWDVRGRILDGLGNPLTDEFPIACEASHEVFPSVVPVGPDFLAYWSSQQPSGAYPMMGQYFADTGASVGPPFVALPSAGTRDPVGALWYDGRQLRALVFYSRRQFAGPVSGSLLDGDVYGNVLPVQPRLYLLPPMAPGQSRLRVHSPAGITNTVLRSENLATWTLLLRTNPVQDRFECADPNSGTNRQRFYRVIAQP